MKKNVLAGHKDQLLPFNLQYFADGVESEEGDNSSKIDEATQKLIESESDRKLQKALEKKEAEWKAAKEKEIAEKVAAAKRDAEEYAKMTEKERKESEFQKRLKELEERERKLNEYNLKIEIEKELKEVDLPVAFSGALIKLEDNEAIKKAIGEIETEFKAAVQEEVKKTLRQETPGDSHHKGSGINPYAKERNDKESQKLSAPDLWA